MKVVPAFCHMDSCNQNQVLIHGKQSLYQMTHHLSLVVYSCAEVNLDKKIIKEDRLLSTAICCTVTIHYKISCLRSLTVSKIQNKLRCILLFI